MQLNHCNGSSLRLLSILQNEIDWFTALWYGNKLSKMLNVSHYSSSQMFFRYQPSPLILIGDHHPIISLKGLYES